MSTVASKILRVLLVFSLTFMVTWHLEYSVAYGVEGDTPPENTTPDGGGDTGGGDNGGSNTGADSGNTDPGTGSSSDPGSGSSSDPDPGTDPGGNTGGNTDPDPSNPSQPPAVEKYAYVKTIEIVKAEGTWDKNNKNENETFTEKGEITPLNIRTDKETKYEFRAKVAFVLKDGTSPGPVYTTPKKGLNTLSGGELPDLVWSIYTLNESDPNDKDHHDVPKAQASIDAKTGVLTITPEAPKKLYVQIKTNSAGETSGNGTIEFNLEIHVNAEGTDEPTPGTDDPQPETVIPVRITYDLNGAESKITVGPTASDETGNATVADLPEGIEAPEEGKVFKGWNTQSDGQGRAFTPGDTINAETIAAIQEAATSDNAEENEAQDEANDSGETSGTGQSATDATEGDANQDTDVLSVVLYAQWGEPSSGTYDGIDPNSRLSISYIPAPLGKNAMLSPVLANVGHVTFYYSWEVLETGESEWKPAFSENAQYLLAPTTEETIGWQYRVSMYADRAVNPEDGSNVLTSAPVTIREAGPDEFLAVLEYTPTYEGEDALLQIQFPNPNAQASGAEIEWMESTDFGGTWHTIASATDTSYYVPTDQEHMGNWYRAVVRRDGAGTTNTCDDPTSGDECSCDPNVACTNVQMLVALSDTDPDDLDPDNFGKNDDVVPGTGPGEDPNSSSGPPSDGDNTPSAPGEDTSEPTDAGGTPTQDIPDAPSSPTPAPQAAPGNTPSALVPIDSISHANEAEAPQSPDGLNVIVDDQVTEQITGETQQTETKEAQQPGARWRELSVIPPQQEIQEVLESNPFAPFVLPLTLALLACGMMERFVAFRRETRPSAASFA